MGGYHTMSLHTTLTHDHMTFLEVETLAWKILASSKKAIDGAKAPFEGLDKKQNAVRIKQVARSRTNEGDPLDEAIIFQSLQSQTKTLFH